MKATLTVLGSGTSMGVPTLGCDCAVCHSQDPHDRRTRPSILLQYGGKSVLIDTTPDFYAQAVREKIHHLDAVFYTHTHADHILGIDDLRPLSYHHKPNKLPLYARPDAAAFLRKMFAYIFEADYKFGGLAQLELHAEEGRKRQLLPDEADPLVVEPAAVRVAQLYRRRRRRIEVSDRRQMVRGQLSVHARRRIETPRRHSRICGLEHRLRR